MVEGDPSNFEKMINKNRKSWLANACLSVKPHPHVVGSVCCMEFKIVMN